MLVRLTPKEVSLRIEEQRKVVAEFNGKHEPYCECKDGFNCDCGLEDAIDWLRHLRACEKANLGLVREITHRKGREMAKFIPPPGHKCSISTHIGELFTFGTGQLNVNGCWEHPCPECARAFEQQFPEVGPCWPHTDEDLQKMGLGQRIINAH